MKQGYRAGIWGMLLLLMGFTTIAQDIIKWQVVHGYDFDADTLKGNWVMHFRNGELHSMGKYADTTVIDTLGRIYHVNDPRRLQPQKKGVQEGQWVYYDWFSMPGTFGKVTYHDTDANVEREILRRNDSDSTFAKIENSSPFYFTYHPNGKTATRGYYVNGKWEGNFTTYDTTGAVTQQDMWEGSVLKSSIFYNADGTRCEGTYKDGLYDGLWTFYYAGIDISDKGKLVEYISQKGNYTNGKQDGLWEYYDENGKKYSTILFKDGVMLKQTYYGPVSK